MATKSVRCRWVLDQLAANRLMTYSAAESVWLARHGHVDVLLAYPTADAAALTEIVADPLLRARVTVMVDHPDHLAPLTAAGASRRQPVLVCLDVDASLRIGPLHLGVRRSPVHTPAQAAAAARRIVATPGLELRGVMAYDAQVAGMPDSSPAVRSAYGRPSAYVAVHQFHRSPAREYFRAFEAIALAHGGRPHWGKLHGLDAGSLARCYPRMGDFLSLRNSLRNELDPGRVFTNRYVRRVLGA